ncbi:MAG TPA: AAA family ATPase [Thermoanaerobaculia bacterium]|nr:AAA family ATPase [Thermoanaerobaculia bacterium]
MSEPADLAAARAASPANAFKVAFVGSHGVGKTTLCYGLAARLKRRDLAVEVVHEVARRCPLPINQQTSVAAQSWILHTQVSEELVAASRYPVVLCDRSLLDNYVYLLLAAGRQPHLEPLLAAWMAGYGLLVHVPIVELPSPDGIRAADPAFQRAVEDRLRRELDERRLPVLGLEAADRAGWLGAVERAVWGQLRPAQLPLPTGALPGTDPLQ